MGTTKATLVLSVLSRWIPGGSMNATQTLHMKKIGSVSDAPLETDLRAHLTWIVGEERHVMSPRIHLEKAGQSHHPA
jgi:hypothetical protein